MHAHRLEVGAFDCMQGVEEVFSHLACFIRITLTHRPKPVCEILFHVHTNVASVSDSYERIPSNDSDES